ncbi:ScbR family autoregulator-binding transcription factor [Rhodococcus sp. ACT016]|uniref:ScbR family autoregulator-binding transcription factor n=1 Tax=Rhodococcus sp. ACT016 TaxID=3134808 RepID=UPI003D285982
MAQQARAVATRRQIALCGAQVFDRLGYYGARVEEIVAGARITKGALYFHFGSKDGLAQWIIREQRGMAAASTAAIAATDASALEQVVMLCHEMVRQIVTDPIVRAGIRLTVELGWSGTDDGGPSDPYNAWTAGCTRFVERAIEQGDVADTVSAPVLARHLICAVAGAQLVSRMRTFLEDLDRYVDEMWAVLLPGIVPAARHDRIGSVSSARWCAAGV